MFLSQNIILPLHVLYIDLVADTVPSIMLAFEQASKKNMKRKIITLLALSTTLALSAQIKLEAGNIDDIIAAMTLKEKVYFVLGVGDEGV